MSSPTVHAFGVIISLLRAEILFVRKHIASDSYISGKMVFCLELSFVLVGTEWIPGFDFVSAPVQFYHLVLDETMESHGNMLLDTVKVAGEFLMSIHVRF